MYPDFRFATAEGESLLKLINDDVEPRHVHPDRRQARRGDHRARGLSSAASAANAAIDHVRDWVLGTNGKWVTMGIPSDGSYGIPEDIIYGVPVTCETANTSARRRPEIDAFSREDGRHAGRAARRARWRCPPAEELSIKHLAGRPSGNPVGRAGMPPARPTIRSDPRTFCRPRLPRTGPERARIRFSPR